MRKITRKRKAKFTQIHQTAKMNDIGFAQVRQLSLRSHQNNEDKKRASKEGVYHDWQNSEFDGFLLMVPIFTNKTHYEIGHQVYLSKAEVPEPFQHLWVESL